MSSAKNLMTITSVFLIFGGVTLAFIWTDPLYLFLSIGMVVTGIVILLLFATSSVAVWADQKTSGNANTFSFNLTESDEDEKS